MSVVVNVPEKTNGGTEARNLIEKAINTGSGEQFELLAASQAVQNGGVLVSDAQFDLKLFLADGTELVWAVETRRTPGATMRAC